MNCIYRTNHIKFSYFSLFFLLYTVLSGCVAVGPDYARPDVTVYNEWNTQSEANSIRKEKDFINLARWWNALGDSQLSELIERAIKGNHDLKKARARVREARALRGVAKADLYPTVEATGSALRSRSSEESGSGATNSIYATGFDASWELDIFGGVRRSVEYAQANLEATEEDHRDILVSLLAELAVDYVDVRTYQARITLAEANLKTQEETCELTIWRSQAGLSDDLAVQQARYNMENTRAGIPTLRTGLEQTINSIAILLGEQPGKLHEELSNKKQAPVVPESIAIGVPADILLRRPDIRKAERNLAAQTAKIGVAVADLYPKFKLSGSIGLEALSTSNLFSKGSHNYSFGSSVTIPIFAGGSIRQNIEVQSAIKEQYLIAYESAVLTALSEVENSLVSFAEEQKRRKALFDATEAARQAVKLSKIKYEAGLTDFNNVLEAERSLMSFEDSLAQSNGEVTSNLIRLYKALGGGWSSAASDDLNQNIL